MKKVIAAVLSGTMALSLAACGGSSAPATTAAAAAPATTAAAAAETTAAAAETTAAAADTTAAAAAAGAAADYSSLEPVELLLADSAAKGAAGSTFDTLIAEKVDQITGGKLTIDLHINGELGNDTDLLRQMQTDDIDMVGCQIAPMVSFIPQLAVFDLPMVFAQYDAAKIDSVLNGDSETKKTLDKAYEDAGWHLLGFCQGATYRLTTANRDLQKLEDFKGMQIRTMENANHMAFWQAIGAEPTPLAWGEVYISLQNGTIEAEENAADTVVGANLNEVQKTLACTNHILYCNQISINKDKFESLDPAYQAALQQAVDEARADMSVQLKEIDESNKKTLADKGMNVITYDNDFFANILEMEDVKKLYEKIDGDTNGLAKTLQAELAK